MAGDNPNVTRLPTQNGAAKQVGFERTEIEKILSLYGRMVTAGHWRDYAMDMGRDAAIFSAFRRSSEKPQMQLEKRPANRNRQGMWTLQGEHGQVLKRGHDLSSVLAPMERKLLKVISS